MSMSGIQFKMQEKLIHKFEKAGANCMENAVTFEEAKLDDQEQYWLDYFAGAFLGKIKKTKTEILIITAGTSDIPVAEEALVTAEILGNTVNKLYDVGVSGIHRILSHKQKLEKASVLITVAGMDGVLPTVVAGLTNKPVIAVPTSVGYGASFNGLAALLTMLNSCASGITVVNIDNGYGAGYAASLINHLVDKA